MYGHGRSALGTTILAGPQVVAAGGGGKPGYSRRIRFFSAFAHDCVKLVPGLFGREDDVVDRESGFWRPATVQAGRWRRVFVALCGDDTRVGQRASSAVTDRTWGIEPHGPLQMNETLAKAHFTYDLGYGNREKR